MHDSSIQRHRFDPPRLHPPNQQPEALFLLGGSRCWRQRAWREGGWLDQGNSESKARTCIYNGGARVNRSPASQSSLPTHLIVGY